MAKLQDDLADGLISSEDFRQMRIRYSDVLSKSGQELAGLQSDTGQKSALLKKALKAINSIGDFYLESEGRTVWYLGLGQLKLTAKISILDFLSKMKKAA